MEAGNGGSSEVTYTSPAATSLGATSTDPPPQIFTLHLSKDTKNKSYQLPLHDVSLLVLWTLSITKPVVLYRGLVAHTFIKHYCFVLL